MPRTRLYIMLMKKIAILLLLIASEVTVYSQITYIGITNHNVGTGNNNLFNNHVAAGQQCYIDWEVYADGMTNMEACGFRSVSRLILRREGDNDTTSVVASAPIVVPGICAGKNGNNDHYYAELSAYIDKPGRYSVEVQADLPNMTYPFENASTKTTYNYSCPSAYYLTGTGGPTGSYYTPSGNCTGGLGLSDPVGGRGADKLEEIFTAQRFFTVGDAGTYREMLILNGNFYDCSTGKFQPGNPGIPSCLDGSLGIPASGICPLSAAPVISLGAEINSFKRTDCGGADVTGAALKYRVYRVGATAPVFDSFDIAFKDDCSFSPNGPEGNIFPTGGSCQNSNGILDQRWQTMSGVANILPASFAISDTGRWRMEFFTETYIKDCTGNSFTRSGDTSITTFSINNPEADGSPCSVIPVIISAFTVSPAAGYNVLTWKVEELTGVRDFTIQRSFDGYQFTAIADVSSISNTSWYSYTDAAQAGKNVFYRIVVKQQNGSSIYSFIVKVNTAGSNAVMKVRSVDDYMLLQLENFAKGKYQLVVMNAAGSLMMQQSLELNRGNSNFSFAIKKAMAHAVYYVVIRDAGGRLMARSDFYY